MKLLQPEIDLVPDRPPAQPPTVANVVGTGSAVLRLFNETAQQNAFSVRLECDSPYWQESWVTMTSLPPAKMPANAALQRDVLGADGHSIRATFVPAGTSRDVVLSFKATSTPEARSGVYRFRVIVEQAVKAGGASRKLPEEQGTLIIRPYFRWTVEVSPEQQTVGRIRRSREYDLIIQNQGNDWLYLDVKTPKPKESLIEAKTVRVAVPPPEPGGESVRRVPFKAITRLKTILGSDTPQPLNFQVVRADAPSVPTLPAQALISPVGAGLGAAVLFAPTQEPAILEPPILLYRPIPKTLTGIGKFITTNIKGLVMGFIGLVVGMGMLVMVWGNAWKEAFKISTLTNQTTVNGTVGIEGKGLADVDMILKNGDKVYELPIVWKPSLTPRIDKAEVKIVGVENNTKYKVSFRRHIPFVPAFISNTWIKDIPQELQVGEAPISSGPSEVDQFVNSSITVQAEQAGRRFGSAPANPADGITIDGRHIPWLTWTNDRIVVQDPHLPVGSHSMIIKTQDGNSAVVPLKVQDIPAPQVPTGTTAGGPAGTTAGLPSGADASGGSGGAGGSSGGSGSGSGGAGSGGTGATAQNNGGGAADNAPFAPPKGYAELLKAVKAGDAAGVQSAIDLTDASTRSGHAMKAIGFAVMKKTHDADRELSAGDGIAGDGSAFESALVDCAGAAVLSGGDKGSLETECNKLFKDLQGKPGCSLPFYAASILLKNAGSSQSQRFKTEADRRAATGT